MSLDPRAVVVANAIRHSMQVNATAGSSVNAHPNPFFINVLGEVDLLKAGESALRALDAYEAGQKKAAEAADSVK
jgi:hypothetical protein